MSDDPRGEAAASDPAVCPVPDPAAPSHSGDIPGLEGPDTLPPRSARRSPRTRARLVDAARRLGGLAGEDLRAPDRPTRTGPEKR